MPKVTINSRIPKRELVAFLRNLPAYFSGRTTHTKASQYRRLFLSAFTENLYGSIYSAYVIKSRGEADELGNEWKPLAESTIRRKLAKMNRRGPMEFDFLTKRQTGLWKKYRQTLRVQLQSTGRLKARDADAKARKLAWWKLRQTKSGSGLQVPIGIDTGELITSIKPGSRVGARYYPAHGQVYQETPTGVRIGTNVEHASHFHRRRRIWPAPKKMRPWLNRAAKAGIAALQAQLAKDVQ
jgi:hypothetical protein